MREEEEEAATTAVGMGVYVVGIEVDVLVIKAGWKVAAAMEGEESEGVEAGCSVVKVVMVVKVEGEAVLEEPAVQMAVRMVVEAVNMVQVVLKEAAAAVKEVAVVSARAAVEKEVAVVAATVAEAMVVVAAAAAGLEGDGLVVSLVVEVAGSVGTSPRSPDRSMFGGCSSVNLS